jgi:hypothetical protein
MENMEGERQRERERNIKLGDMAKESEQTIAYYSNPTGGPHYLHPRLFGGL